MAKRDVLLEYERLPIRLRIQQGLESLRKELEKAVDRKDDKALRALDERIRKAMGEY